MIFKIILTGILASGILTNQVCAQRGGGGGGRNSGSNIPTMAFGGTRFDRISEVLKLNKDQKKEVKAALDDAQKLATPIHDQMMKGRQAIAGAGAGRDITGR